MNDELMESQEPVIEIPPDIEPQPDSESTAPPMEVIPVDDLLDRLGELLAEKDASENPEAEQPMETVDGDVDIPVPAPDPVTGILEIVVEHILDMIVDLGKIEEHTAAIEGYTQAVAQTLDHPALTTSFADYTVTEALLLFLLLSVFMSACARILRGGFSWLRS